MQNATIHATYYFPHLQEHATGAFSIEFCLSKAAAGPLGKEYLLQFQDSKNDQVLFQKQLKPSEDTAKVRIIINTHLLPNGPAEFHVSILNSRGKVEWSDKISFPVMNAGPLAAQVRESMQKFGTPLFVDEFCDSSHYDYNDPALIPWFDRPDAPQTIQLMREKGQITDAEQTALLQFVTEGYLIVPEAVDSELLEQANKEIDAAIGAKWEGYTYGSSQRLQQLHQTNPGIRKLWQHPLAFRYLDLIFGVPAKPCQTLVFVFGSQQAAHQDSIHLTPFPSGYMCGVWIPLEDVQPNSGELQVFPKSHKLPRIRMRTSDCPKVTTSDWSVFGEKVVSQWGKLIREHNLEKIAYRPKKGSILIWHENLLHAGSPRIDKSLSRRSIVIHSFAEGSVAYYDSSGIPGFVYKRE